MAPVYRLAVELADWRSTGRHHLAFDRFGVVIGTADEAERAAVDERIELAIVEEHVG
ncbi:MAG TPA: hypothetical protein VH023_05395 [Rhodopila sp.]|nr:hypothetical protein [Rhodopila sp.]